jgi:hypothetical protein
MGSSCWRKRSWSSLGTLGPNLTVCSARNLLLMSSLANEVSSSPVIQPCYRSHSRISSWVGGGSSLDVLGCPGLVAVNSTELGVVGEGNLNLCWPGNDVDLREK